MDWKPRGLTHLLFVLLLGGLWACSYGDEGPIQDQLTPTSIHPIPNSLNVPLNASISLTFEVPIDAETITQSTLSLFSGRIQTPGRTHVDLARRSISFVPTRELRSDLRYQVRLQRGVRGLDGSSLASHLIFGFTTGSDTEPDAPPRPKVTDADLQELWQAHCTTCHRAPDPPAGVDLSDPPAARRSLVGVRSADSHLLRVVAGDHARSYLMRKLLGVGGYSGFAMPPESRLSAEAIATVADWIDQIHR